MKNIRRTKVITASESELEGELDNEDSQATGSLEGVVDEDGVLSVQLPANADLDSLTIDAPDPETPNLTNLLAVVEAEEGEDRTGLNSFTILGEDEDGTTRLQLSGDLYGEEEVTLNYDIIMDEEIDPEEIYQEEEDSSEEEDTLEIEEDTLEIEEEAENAEVGTDVPSEEALSNSEREDNTGGKKKGKGKRKKKWPASTWNLGDEWFKWKTVTKKYVVRDGKVDLDFEVEPKSKVSVALVREDGTKTHDIKYRFHPDSSSFSFKDEDNGKTVEVKYSPSKDNDSSKETLKDRKDEAIRRVVKIQDSAGKLWMDILRFPDTEVVLNEIIPLIINEAEEIRNSNASDTTLLPEDSSIFRFSYLLSNATTPEAREKAYSFAEKNVVPDMSVMTPLASIITDKVYRSTENKVDADIMAAIPGMSDFRTLTPEAFSYLSKISSEKEKDG